jgi:hypothetical protein
MTGVRTTGTKGYAQETESAGAVQINLAFMPRLSPCWAKLARSLGSGRSGNAEQSLKKHFKHKEMNLRPTSLNGCVLEPAKRGTWEEL